MAGTPVLVTNNGESPGFLDDKSLKLIKFI